MHISITVALSSLGRVSLNCACSLEGGCTNGVSWRVASPQTVCTAVSDIVSVPASVHWGRVTIADTPTRWSASTSITKWDHFTHTQGESIGACFPETEAARHITKLYIPLKLSVCSEFPLEWHPCASGNFGRNMVTMVACDMCTYSIPLPWKPCF